MSNTRFQKRVLMVAVGAAALAACAPDVSREERAKASEGYVEDTNKLFVVDCLLPGQVRKLGSQMSYISQRRPIRTTAADCEVRGGEYVAYDRANYASALKVWLPKAQEGDAEAQDYVGQIFEKGLGQPTDYQAAAQWYQKAAAQGNAQAQLNLGHLYEKGLGLAQDMIAANQWYRKAAGLESANLQFTPALPETAPVQDREIESLRQEAGKTRQEVEQSRREAEQSRQEAARLRQQLLDSQRQVLGQQEALRRAQEEMEAARLLREQASSSQADDTSGRRLEERLREKEAQMKAQQDRLTAMTAALNDAEQSRREAAELRGQLAQTEQQLSGQRQSLLEAQQELDEIRRRQEQTPPSQPEALRRVQEELRHKQAQLDAQQSKVATLTATLSKERPAQTRESKSVHRHATPVRVLDQPATAEGARTELAQVESLLGEKINQYQKSSSELTTWLTGSSAMDRARIDQRKKELLAQAKEISSLREKIEQQGRQLADQGQPDALNMAQGPRIEILDPPLTLTRGMPSIQVVDGDRRKEIVGRINAQDGLSSLIINDRPQTVDASGIFRTPLNVAGEPGRFKIVATDKKNRHSDLIVTLLGESGVNSEIYPAAASRQEGERPKDVEFGQFHALIIGNADYKAYAGLKTPINDAKSVELILRERYGFKTKLLINANRHQIMTALNEMNKRLSERDNFLIYYAGHGEIDKATQSAYWLPIDAEVGNSANWISSHSITEYLGIMAARHVMVVADSCYSGALTGSAIARLPEGMDESKRAKWLKVMNSRKARTVLTSGGVQPVLDQGGGDHSIFASAFLKVLRGNKKPVLEDYDLFRDVSNQVRSAAARVGFQQSPQYAPLQHAGHEGSPFFFVPEA
ncbi:MAG: caspase family protein [Methylococcaceae bacterium]|nr:caspase family protein [Methylococcaceae bacterium]